MKVKKQGLIYALMLCLITVLSLNGQQDQAKFKKVITTPAQKQEKVSVKGDQVMQDTLYAKLLKEGWSRAEALTIMEKIAGRELVSERNSPEMTLYRKAGKPFLSSGIVSSAGRFLAEESTANVHQVGGMLKAQAATNAVADPSWDREFYDHTARLRGRTPGRFRHAPTFPASGRMEWAVVHPDDPNKLYCHPDGDGIWATDNMGRNWRPISDNIPNRYHRSATTSYGIPVDPDDWNHLFALVSYAGYPVYESFDGGSSWSLIAGATHKDFKRSYAFRNAANELILIGAIPSSGSSSALWLSKDKGVTWKQLNIDLTIFPDSYKLSNSTGLINYWFQEFCFHPTAKGVVWVPCKNAIFRTDDGFNSLTKMTFNVYAIDGTTLRNANVQHFPFLSDAPMMMNVNPNNPSEMWAVLSNRVFKASALYKSTDGGANWITIHEQPTVSGQNAFCLFGQESAWVWLGGFGVNYSNPNKIWGTTMGSAYSSDGGVTMREYSWAIRLNGIYPDGNKYLMSVGSHNADNHFILPHKSGRLFRGCDTGILTLDPDASTEWYNISGDMGQQLFAHLQCNEFGAQTMIGNTQDCNAQTYRKGRWGKDRGYETSTAWINSISSEEHFSGGWSTKKEMTNADYNSYNPGWSKTDVCNSIWYLRRSDKIVAVPAAKFFAVRDGGQVAVSLDMNLNGFVRDFALARDTKEGRVYVLTENKQLYYSDNQGQSFNYIKKIDKTNCIAVNPLNQKEIYLGGDGILLKSIDGGGSFTSIYANLPAGVSFSYLFYHEGTGDLYAVGLNDGVFYQQNGTNTWRLWMTGYNPAAFSTAMINYTTQEFIINDYGRGAWIADLERPADRFFSNLCSPPDQFKLRVKELSNFGGKRTLGIDTYWTIPMYYKYEWYVDDMLVSNSNYQFLTNCPLTVGQKVKLKLTLLESPDVTTWSEEYTVPNTASVLANQARGNTVTSTRSGRIDLGYNDYFSSDFTVDFWTKVNKEGVLIANRQKHDNSAKGWYLSVEAGKLKFNYAPQNVFCRPLNETSNNADAIWPSKTIDGGAFAFGQWAHVAISHQTNGNIVVYVDGKVVLTEPRQMADESLNNACNLSLFADAYGNEMIDASVDELRIWNAALSVDAVRKVMTTHVAPVGTKLLYQQSFNDSSIELQKELFTRKGMQIRVEGDVAFEASQLSISGEAVDGSLVSSLETTFSDGSKPFAKVVFKTLPTNLTLYCTRYDDDFLFSPTGNINASFHTVCSNSFGFKAYNINAYRNDSIKLFFYIDPMQAPSYNGERVYSTGLTKSKEVWTQIGKLKYNAVDHSLECTLKLSDIEDKELILVKVSPAIELCLSTPKEANALRAYTDNDLQVMIKAQTIGGKTAPLAAYLLSCSKPEVSFSNPINFFNDEGTTNLSIPKSLLGGYGTTTELTISGDNQAIPLHLKVENRIIPNGNLKGLRVNKGGAVLGHAGDYMSMDGSNTLSMACWVRLEDTTMLSGFHPILLVRGSDSKSYGMHLEGGELRCHWNEEAWSWGLSTGLKITSDLIGKWVHVALVSDPTGITYYLNGRSYRSTRTMNPTGVKGALMIFKNTEGDNGFVGSIDEISLWNKTLSFNDVIYLMHNSPINNDNLVAHLNFERKNQASTFIDNIKDLTLRTTGAGIEEINSSEIPFISDTQYSMLTGDQRPQTANMGLGINFGTSLTSNFSLVRFARLIDNVLDGIPNGFAPLFSNFFTLTTSTVPTTSNASIRIVASALAVGDEVLIASRYIGKQDPLTVLAQHTVTTAGEIELTCQASLLSASQLAVYHKSSSVGVPMVTSLSSATAQTGRVILKEGETTIPVTLKWVSGDRDTSDITTSSSFASIDRTNADLTLNSSADFTVTINKAYLNTFDWNTLQINATGANPLNVEVALAPKIELSLVNGNSANSYSSSNVVADLIVKADLKEGVLDTPLEFNVNSSVATSTVMTMGSLLAESSVVSLPLSTTSGATQVNSGWALIGNPYLSQINLTQPKNVEGRGVGRFVYPFDPITRNFKAVDMLAFDATQQLAPFSTFFVQSLGNDAQLAIHPEAKDSPQLIGRKLTALSEVLTVRLGLFAGDTQCDELSIRFVAGGSEGFVPNEDGVKIWSYDQDVRGMGAWVDATALSVAAFPLSNVEIPLIFNIPLVMNANLSLRMLSNGLASGDKVMLKSGSTSTLLSTSSIETLTLNGGETNLTTYSIAFDLLTTDQDRLSNEPYKVITDGKQCSVVGIKGNARICIFDTMGKLVVDQKSNNRTFTTQLLSGTYIVKVIENGREFTASFIIK